MPEIMCLMIALSAIGSLIGSGLWLSKRVFGERGNPLQGAGSYPAWRGQLQ